MSAAPRSATLCMVFPSGALEDAYVDHVELTTLTIEMATELTTL